MRPAKRHAWGREGTVRAARELLVRHHAEHLTSAEAARRVRVSTRTMEYAFAAVGSSFHAELRRVRLNQAARLIARGATRAEAARAVGYSSQSQFGRSFREHHGVTVTEFRRGAA